MHTANETITLFKETFGDRNIWRCVPMAWRLTPLDYFLRGYVR